MSSFGFSYGAFGELLQGILPNERHFLITLPINLKSKAYFKPNYTNKFIVNPKYKTKVKHFANLLAINHKVPIGGEISIESEIPIGKGLSSSTADIVATYHAISKIFNVANSIEDIEQLIRQIEPSDGLLYNGVVAYYHREVSLLKKFNYYPNLVVVAIDEGGIVDTVKYNQIKKTPSLSEKYEFKELLLQCTDAIKVNDIKKIGRIATRSTELNQKYNYKPSFNNILETNYQIDGLGVICAHSGTYIGILLDKSDIKLNYKIDYCYKIFTKLNKKLELFYTTTADSYNEVPFIKAL